MTFEEFIRSVAEHDQPPSSLSDALRALWYAERGAWDTSHRIAQDIANSEGSWVHANLHREEGDIGNARYWYARANRPESNLSVADERHDIIKELL